MLLITFTGVMGPNYDYIGPEIGPNSLTLTGVMGPSNVYSNSDALRARVPSSVTKLSDTKAWERSWSS